MGNIEPFPRNSVFDPQDIEVMSIAFVDVCKALKLDNDARAKEIIAVRIIELVRRGEHNPNRLRDRLLREAGNTV